MRRSPAEPRAIARTSPDEGVADASHGVGGFPGRPFRRRGLARIRATSPAFSGGYGDTSKPFAKMRSLQATPTSLTFAPAIVPLPFVTVHALPPGCAAIVTA